MTAPHRHSRQEQWQKPPERSPVTSPASLAANMSSGSWRAWPLRPQVPAEWSASARSAGWPASGKQHSRCTQRTPAARVSFSQALELNQTMTSVTRLGAANALRGLGIVQLAIRDSTAAAASLDRALTMYRDLGDRLGEAWVLAATGTLHYRTGNYAAATTSLSRALAINQDLGRPLDQAKVLNNLGELSLACATPAQALEHYKQALAIGTSIGSPEEEARALEGIGQCRSPLISCHQPANKSDAERVGISSPASQRPGRLPPPAMWSHRRTVPRRARREAQARGQDHRPPAPVGGLVSAAFGTRGSPVHVRIM